VRDRQSTGLRFNPLRLVSLGAVNTRTLAETIDGHNNNYTLIRVILAASVIYYHSFFLTRNREYTDYISQLLSPVSDVGSLAVQMFFFLSGLFVAQSFHKSQGVPGFTIRRAARIWPGYFICLVLTAVIFAAMSGPASFFRYLAFDGFYRYILANSAFDLTWNIEGLLSEHPYPGLNGSIHTLPMEAKMYVVLACLGALGMLRGPRRIAIAGAVAIILAFTPAAVHALPFNLFDQLYSRTAAVLFLTGVTAYGLSQWIRVTLWQGALLFPMTVLTAGATREVFFYGLAVWGVLLFGESDFIGRLGRPKQDLSYGIYIYGFPSQQIVLALASLWLNPYFLMAASLPLAATFAFFSWRLVEKPAMAFGGTLDKTRFDVRAAWAEHPVLPLVLSGLLLVVSIGAWASARFDHVPARPMGTQIIDFGPKESRVGQPINQRPNGDSAIWLKLDGTPGDGTFVIMDGRRLETVVVPGVATARVDPSILDHAGDKIVLLEHRFLDRTERSRPVIMKITP